eukprot:SAG31_NODE_327_length_17650_cov_18.626574_16_plen_175_part_00
MRNLFCDDCHSQSLLPSAAENGVSLLAQFAPSFLALCRTFAILIQAAHAFKQSRTVQIWRDGLLQHDNASGLVLLLRQVYQRAKNALHVHALILHLFCGLRVVLQKNLLFVCMCSNTSCFCKITHWSRTTGLGAVHVERCFLLAAPLPSHDWRGLVEWQQLLSLRAATATIDVA